MKKILILTAVVALFLISLKAGSASYSYWGSNYAGIYPSYNRGYQASSAYYSGGGYMQSAYVNDGMYVASGSHYGARYRGGIFPVYYQQPSPYGYQSGAFSSGTDYGKSYRSTSQSIYYGRGGSDWFYDGQYMRQSQYYVY